MTPSSTKVNTNSERKQKKVVLLLADEVRGPIQFNLAQAINCLITF